MRISQLTHLLFYLNGALGSGKYDHISIEQVKERIDHGTIFNFLASALNDDLDLSILEEADKASLLNEWREMLDIREGKKFCVNRNGICLLNAYLIEGLQRRRAESFVESK